MRISDVMTSPAITVRFDAPWPEVAERMVSARVSGLPVVADDDRLVGVVTEADLLSQPAFGVHRSGGLEAVVETVQGHPQWLYELVEFNAGQLMNTALVVAHPDEDVAEAVRRMLDHHVKWLPVVQGDRVVGVVARRDVLAAAWPREGPLVLSGATSVPGSGPGSAGGSR
jgi:CBS domain-containing protein